MLLRFQGRLFMKLTDKPGTWGYCRLLVVAVTIISAAHVVPAGASNLTVTIQASPKLLTSPVAQTAIDDTRALLQQAMPSAHVSINRAGARVVIALPDTIMSANRPYPPLSASTVQRLPSPDRSYRWKSRTVAGHTVLR